MNQSKTLVVYFSRANENYNVGTIEVGNIELLAKEIIKLKQADEFKIIPTKPYPADYSETVALATEELNNDARPTYRGDIDLAPYDTIYLGYPIWWSDLPMIVYSFLEQHDFSGKTIFPFCSHEGSGNAGTFNTLKSQLSSATVQEGFAITGVSARTPAGLEELHTWLDKA